MPLNRTTRAALLAALALAWAAGFAFALQHADLARDVRIADAMVGGGPWPLLGPVLAGTLHLGPAWYWLLALLRGAGLDWDGIVAAIALLSALQFPLAYLAGKAVHSRNAGLWWAALLLVPSWALFGALFPQHPTLAPTLLLAALWLAARALRHARTRDFAGCALACALAVHAHPSLLGLAPVGLALAAALAWQGRLRMRAALAAAVAALLPFLPLAWAQASGQFDFAHALAAYLASPQGAGSVAEAPALAWAALAGGGAYLLDPMLGAGPGAAWLAHGLWALLLVGAAAGWLRAPTSPPPRPSAPTLLGVALVLALGSVLLRAHHPYYMVDALRVPLCGLLAVGWACGQGGRTARAPALAVVGAAALHVAAWAALAPWLLRGVLPFALLPIGDVVAPAQAPVPMPVLPAYAAQRVGDAACARAPLALHGPWASQWLHAYGVGTALGCRDAGVVAGGNDRGRAHWIGLPRRSWDAIGRAPTLDLGPLGIAPARRLPAPVPARDAPAPSIYPPIAPSPPARVIVERPLVLQADEWLAVTHLGFALSPAPGVAWQVDGTVRAADAGDGLTRLFHCPAGCRGTLRIEAADPAQVDVVVF